MPVRFKTSSETEGVIVKELLVEDDGGKTRGSRRGKLAINIRILPHKKQHTKVARDSSEISWPLHRQHCHHQQEHSEWPTTAKRTRFSFSCWSAEEDDNHLHHYDVVTHDVTYNWSTAATASCVSYSSCDLHCYNSHQLRNCNDDEDSDDERRRRSYRTSPNSVSNRQCDAAPAGDSDCDEVFEDSTENEADLGHCREVLRPMNAGSASGQRRQRISLPQPPRHRPGRPRAGVSNAVTTQPATERKPALLRRTLTDLEAAEIAAGYPDVYYVGDTAAVNAAVSTRRPAAAKKTEDSGCATRADDSKKTYDDEESYYIHVPHDQIAYR